MRAALTLIVLAAAPDLGAAQGAGEGGRLGTITFPTSGSAAAQPEFLRGVLYLHSFEYERAGEAFRAAQRLDPGFAMAYWGEALSLTHPVWNEQDLPAARAILARLAPNREARAAKAGTARERAWLEAVELLYGDGPKAQRDTLYAAAMDRLAAAYPDDEAQAFRALAQLGLNQGVREAAAYMRAGSLALDLMHRNPDHPGAAHYAIHAFDDPVHAPLGLAAARAYSGIAPGAAHAQHMTTHIFLALGMWPEVIAQNVIAAGPDRSRWQAGHYTYWLHYGLLQAGRTEEAAALLAELKAHQSDSAAATAPRRIHLAMARAQQVITGERWSDSALAWTIVIPPQATVARAVDGFAAGFAALHRGDSTLAAARLAELRRLPSGTGLAAVPGLLARQLEAVLARRNGDRASADRLLRAVAEEAAALPVEFGPPDFVKPPYELLGEWLLEDGRTDLARQAFTRSLALMPGRALSLRGLGIAERQVGSGARP